MHTLFIHVIFSRIKESKKIKSNIVECYTVKIHLNLINTKTTKHKTVPKKCPSENPFAKNNTYIFWTQIYFISRILSKLPPILFINPIRSHHEYTDFSKQVITPTRDIQERQDHWERAFQQALKRGHHFFKDFHLM